MSKKLTFYETRDQLFNKNIYLLVKDLDSNGDVCYNLLRSWLNPSGPGLEKCIYGDLRVILKDLRKEGIDLVKGK